MRPVVEGLVGNDGRKAACHRCMVAKLESCDSHYLSSSEGYLSNEYSGASCDPEAARERHRTLSKMRRIS